MKIAFLIRSLEIGGAERQLSLLASGLKKKGHDVSVLVFYGGGPLEAELIKDNIRIINLKKKGRWDIALFLIKFFHSIKIVQPDVVYSFLTVSNLIAVLSRIVFPSIKIVWGLRASNMDLQQYDWLSRFSGYLEKKLAFLAQAVIANSYTGRDYANKIGFSAKSISVIPNGIALSRFYPDASLGMELRSRWGIGETEQLIGMIARIDPMKDYPTFLRAAAILARKRKEVRFVCVGRGSEQEKSQLKMLIKHLDLEQKVILCEEQLAPEKAYNALDLFCLSSSFGEGFSNVVGEAMACGLTCVATDVGDAALILGEYGKVVPIKDPDSLATALDNMLEQKFDKKLVRERIQDNFSIEKMIQTTEKVLQGLLV